MAAQSVENLNEKLVCAVCQNTLKNPKLLACFHAFCEECLKQGDQIEVRSGELKCPECSTVTDLPGEGVAGLDWNPLLCRLVEVLQAKAIQIMCDACGDSELPLTTYCRDCLSFICDSCASYHGKMKVLLKDHHTVPLDKIINGTIQWVKEGLWRKAHECEEHIGELRRFYCRTCKKRICRDCIVLDHTKPDHDCTTVQKMFQETKEKVKDRLTSCKEKEERVSTMLNDVDVREKGANQNFHVMKERIQDLKSTAVANLNKAEEELLHKVELLEEKFNDKVQVFRDNMKTTKGNFTRAQSKAKEVVSAKEVTDISRGPFLPEDVLKELEEMIASDVTMTISMDLLALRATMIEGSKLPEQMARFAKLTLPHIWRETQMFPIPDKDIVNIFADGNSIYVACKKGIYKKLLSHDADPSTWMKLQHNVGIKQVVDMAMSMKDQSFFLIAETDAGCTQLFSLKLDDFPTYQGHAAPSSSVSTVAPCPLNPSTRITVDTQSCIVVADNKPVMPSLKQATSSSYESASETKRKHTTPSATNVNASSFSLMGEVNSNKRPVAADGGEFTFGLKLPQQQHSFTGTTHISQTVSAFGCVKSISQAESVPSPLASKGKETRPEIPKAGSSIFTASMKIYKGKPEISSSGSPCGSTTVNQGSSDSFKVPLDMIRSLAAAKSGQFVFLRWDKKAVIITDKDGRVQHEIKEPGRMYLSISCTESDALYVLSAFWGSHIVTLTKHSLQDGGLLEYLIEELNVSANFQSDDWPVIGNCRDDLVIMHTGEEIRVYSAEDWDILDDEDVSAQDQDDNKGEDV